MRLFGLPKGPATIRLQELHASYGFASKFRKRLAKTLVIELDADEEAGWGVLYYQDLLELLRNEKILSLTLARGRFDYRHKEADPDHDGMMGWVWALREECVGPRLAQCIEKMGLPPTLTELSFRDAGVNAIAAKQLLSALPPGIEKLDLQQNDLGEEGVAAIATAELPSLTELRFGWTSFGDTHAAALVDAARERPALARVEIVAGPLSELSRKRLGDRFGDVLRMR